MSSDSLHGGATVCGALWVAMAFGGTWQSVAVASEPGGLEEVVVTAERRVQNQQSVPISVSVLTADDLESKGVNSVADLQQAAPGVAINSFGRSTFINIRGVGINRSAPSSVPGVAYYIDGVLIPHEQFIGQSFYDIASIEVLRGPQGTLTGQNSTGGAIYVRTPQVNYGQYSATADATVGSFGKRRLMLAGNLGFNDQIGLRLAAVHDERDSHVTNIGPSGRTPGNMTLDSVRGDLGLRLLEQRLRINLRGEYFDYQSDNLALKRRGDIVSTDPFVIEEDANSFLNQRGYRVAGEVRFDLTQNLELRVLSSWQNGYTHDRNDGDHTATAVATNTSNGNVGGRVNYATNDFKTRIHEINLLSGTGGPLQWVVGAFSMDDDVPITLQTDTSNSLDYLRATSIPAITQAINDSDSLFGQVNWFVTPEWELLAGLRHSWDKQTYLRFVASNVVFSPPYVGTPQKSQANTGKVGVNWHLDPDLMLYVTASRGYKAGGVNLNPGTPNVAPEYNTVIELGIKSEWLNHHLRLNADVFNSRYTDMQLGTLANGSAVTQNAGAALSRGGELEVAMQFDAWASNLALGYLDTGFDGDACISDANNAGTDAGCATGLRRVPDGRTLPLSPRWTVSAGTQYTWNLANDWAITPRLQWAHLSRQYATPFISATTTVPSRDVTDVRVSMDHGKQWRLEASVTNLTDKVYVASQVQNTANAIGGTIYGSPRAYGLQVVYNYGR